MRRDGIVSIEYEKVAAQDQKTRLSLLKEGAERLRALGPATSRSAAGIADDYVAITDSILQAFGTEPELTGDGRLAADPWA